METIGSSPPSSGRLRPVGSLKRIYPGVSLGIAALVLAFIAYAFHTLWYRKQTAFVESTPVKARAFTFGPVKEMNLGLNNNGISDGLDFDTGTVFSLAAMKTDAEASVLGAHFPKGMSGMAVVLKPANTPLQHPLMVVSRGLSFAPLLERKPGSGWDEESLQQLLKSYPPASLGYLKGLSDSSSECDFDDLPKTFTFVSANGNIGLFQIIGVSDDRHAVKIR
ncbi:MAG: hypothetical protein ABSA83_24190 [Verrucomicrobiota bacterium]